MKMREKRISQLSIFHTMPRNEVARELEAISRILDENPGMYELVYQDMVRSKRPDTGREGMTAEQVLRCTILKQYRNLSYEELAFHLEDSHSFRAFSRLGMGQRPGVSTLQENIKGLRPRTWEAVNRLLIRYAEAQRMEKGRTVRLDSTAIESNIHYPTDSRLLEDAIRVITRLLIEGRRLRPVPGYRFSDHRRLVKKRVMAIVTTRSKKVRQKVYGELLTVAGRVVGYGRQAIAELDRFHSDDAAEVVRARVVMEKLQRALMIFGRVMDQTERRVMGGEKVPASEKVVSFFEVHTDIIEKGGRETSYGHKLYLTGGRSGLILDCRVVRGNPRDSSLFSELISRQQELYGRVPRQVASDGGFASVENLRWAKAQGITDVMFSKRRGLSVLDMAKSHWVYRRLRNFRAGIEASISWLKRTFGLARCTWKGWKSFRQYVWSAVLSYNLHVLARLKMATA
jgi:IS5 family transposase